MTVGASRDVKTHAIRSERRRRIKRRVMSIQQTKSLQRRQIRDAFLVGAALTMPYRMGTLEMRETKTREMMSVERQE